MESASSPPKPTRYLVLNLDKLNGTAPDWLLLVLELARQQKMRGLNPGERIELRNPIWLAAYVVTKDRRKKVLAHIIEKFGPEFVAIERHPGRVSVAIIGPKLSTLSR